MPQYRDGCYLPIKTVCSVGWMILEADDSDPKVGLTVVQRASKPLLTPAAVPGGWALGQAPALCKQPNIVFVEGAEALGKNQFRIYFGAADATEGSAVVQVDVGQAAAAAPSVGGAIAARTDDHAHAPGWPVQALPVTAGGAGGRGGEEWSVQK